MADALLNNEPLITLSQAAARFPGARGAVRLHPATLTRWILKGARARDGRRVRLEAWRCGSRWLTSVAALERFTAALSAIEEPAASRSPAARERASERAAAELRAMGC